MIEVSKTALQPVLYKYCPPERIDIISSFRIRFSPPSHFNDIFDTHFIPPPACGMETALESARARLARARLRERFGILCLTEEADNRLMWVNSFRKMNRYGGWVKPWRSILGGFLRPDRAGFAENAWELA